MVIEMNYFLYLESSHNTLDTQHVDLEFRYDTTLRHEQGVQNIKRLLCIYYADDNIYIYILYLL